MEPGDRLIFRTAGGGGWGDPRLRDGSAITDDVAKGYVSAEAARSDYGYEEL
jgi:N-methylhydantoinase B